MSYSVSATRATRAELGAVLHDELKKVVEAQPVHQADIGQAFDAMHSLLAMTFDDPARDIAASVSGSIWKTADGIEQVSLSVNIQHVARKAQ